MKQLLLICAAAIVLLGCTGCAQNNDPAHIASPSEPDASQSGESQASDSAQTPASTIAETTTAVQTTADTAAELSEEVSAESTSPSDEEAETEIRAEAETMIKTSNETQPEDEPGNQPDESGEEPINKDYIYQDEDDFFYVVNKTYLLPEDYEIETDYVQGSYEMEKTAAKHMREMIAAAKEDGINLKVLSAYRTINYQKKLFERNVNSRMEDYGMSYEEAYYDTSINIAPPGGSEHNAGLAADIVTENDWDTYTGFEDTEEFAWLQEHAPEYGFILRYLKGKEDITGYIYEPWHYRYVGVKYAADVMNSGLCLEEYFEKYVWVDGEEPSFPFES